MKLRRLAAIPGTVLLIGATMAGGLMSPRASAAAGTDQHVAINCEYSAVCAEVANSSDVFGSEYVGHDEPSAVFYSNVPGSGNHMTYSLRLPHDPSPNNPNKAGRSYQFELNGAMWFGMALCATQSYPEQVSTCAPDSDSNILDPAVRRNIRAPRSWNCSSTRRGGFPGRPGRSRWARLANRSPIMTNSLLARRTRGGCSTGCWGCRGTESAAESDAHVVYARAAAGWVRTSPVPICPVRASSILSTFTPTTTTKSWPRRSYRCCKKPRSMCMSLPPGSSGMAALIVGDVDHAREQALANLRVLANAVRDGYTVVCSEPTAALMLREEYVKLTEDLDADLVAASTMDVGQYLLGLDARGQLPRPRQPLHARVGYHQPCHLRALDVGNSGARAVAERPRARRRIHQPRLLGHGRHLWSSRDRFWTSLRAGRGLLRRLRDADIDIGSTECGACRIQMEQGVAKRTLHPIKLLSLGYGLNPSLGNISRTPSRGTPCRDEPSALYGGSAGRPGVGFHRIARSDRGARTGILDLLSEHPRAGPARGRSAHRPGCLP